MPKYTKVRARLRMLSKKDGGRRKPIDKVYRSSVFFSMDRNDVIDSKGRLYSTTDEVSDQVNLKINASADFVDFVSIPKGLNCTLTFKYLSPSLRPFIYPGRYFLVVEFRKIVGEGVMEEVIYEK